MLNPVMIMCSRLEASFFGQTEHMIMECNSSKQKKEKFLGSVKLLNVAHFIQFNSFLLEIFFIF